MKYGKRSVTEAQAFEIAELSVAKKAFIGLDVNDVKAVVAGRECVLVKAEKDAEESNKQMMESFFSALSKEAEVRNCTAMLIQLCFSEANGMTMEDMNFVHEFAESLPEDTEVRWGMNMDDCYTQMRIYVVIAKDKE